MRRLIVPLILLICCGIGVAYYYWEAARISAMENEALPDANEEGER